MSQAFGVRDTCDTLWLTQQRFIAHQVYVEGIAGKTLEEKKPQQRQSGNVTCEKLKFSGKALVRKRSWDWQGCHALRAFVK